MKLGTPHDPPPPERVVVTGVGVVSAFGAGAEATFRRLMTGERAFGPVQGFDPKDARCRLAAEVLDLDIASIAPKAERDAWSRTDALAFVAAREALAAARYAGGRLGVAHAGTTGAMLETEHDLFAPPAAAFEPGRALRFLTEPLCATTERLARVLGAGPLRSTVCAACASSGLALVQAMDWVRRGAVDLALAGGADALCSLTFFGFEALGALDPEPCRPFDKARRGLSLGEAGAFLVLERESRARAREAPILAILSGAATGAEAHHVTHPEPSGKRAAALIGAAIASAGLEPREIDYVNAHGTGTLPNDRMEAKALRAALGESSRAFVSSSKGQLGHTLGAAAALEAVITVLALGRGEVPPTAGLEHPEEEALRHVKGHGEPAPLRAALSCSFGFGGTGAVVLFERADAPARALAPASSRFVVTGLATLGAHGAHEGEAVARYAEPAAAVAPRPAPGDPLELLAPERSRRFDRPTALVTAVVERALADARQDDARTGLVVGTAFGSVERTVRFIQKAVLGGPRVASPAEFPHLVVSAASGNASIYLGLEGPVFATSDRETSAESALAAAVALLSSGQATALAAGAAEAFDALVRANHARLGPAPAKGERGEGAAFLVVESEAAALARGARVLCRVAGPLAFDASVPDAEIPGPRVAERAVVVAGALSAEHETLVARSAWGRCVRRSVLGASGYHEAASAFALCSAAALAASARYDEALAVGGRGAVLWVTHFSRFRAESGAGG
ncbi:MAG TPA: beta-ketoacyl-[acyl-carrier-protein] synthase family protein [Polyangiaceae bacterium]